MFSKISLVLIITLIILGIGLTLIFTGIFFTKRNKPIIEGEATDEDYEALRIKSQSCFCSDELDICEKNQYIKAISLEEKKQRTVTKEVIRRLKLVIARILVGGIFLGQILLLLPAVFAFNRIIDFVAGEIILFAVIAFITIQYITAKHIVKHL